MYFGEIVKPGISTNQQPNVNTNELHQFVWTLFHPMPEIRNFLYTLYNGKIYVVSSQKPQANGHTDLQIRVNDYDVSFKKGMPLRFDVRLSLSTRISYDQKIPLITAYKKKQNENLNWSELMHGALNEWFNKHSHKYGFRVRNFFVNGSHFYHFQKTGNGKKEKNNGNDKAKTVRFHSMDVCGVLEVLGPEVFVNTLYQGIGKARCYGCGLMLVAP